MLIAVNHHYIRHQFNLPYPGIQGITPAFFREKLQALSLHGEFISAAELVSAIEGTTTLPDRAIMITFDDGLREQFEYALPVLEELNIPALFFINTINTEGKVSNVHKIHQLRSYLAPADFSRELFSFITDNNILSVDRAKAATLGAQHYLYDDELTASIKYILNFVFTTGQLNDFVDSLFPKYFNEAELAADLYMTNDQLKLLQQKGWLGAHGHEHLPLGQLDEPEAAYQVARSQEIIQSITGSPVTGFSFPYGSEESCKGMDEILSTNGFKFAFTMKRGGNEQLDNPFYLHRFDNNDMPLGKSCRFETGMNIFESLQAHSHAR